MKKKILQTLFISLVSPLILSGCFGSDAISGDAPRGFHEYKTDDVSMVIPDAWEVIPPDQFLSGVPTGTIVAFRNNVRDAVYTPTVVVVRNDLRSEFSTMDFTKTLIEKTKGELTDSREVRRETVEINVGGGVTETLFLHLNGKTAADSEPQDWMQISAVKGNTAFVATGSMLADTDDATKEVIEGMVRSFKVR